MLPKMTSSARKRMKASFTNWPNITLTTITETQEEIDMSTNNTNDGTLKTSDPIRAAALVSFGIRLIDAVADKDSSRLIFVFDDTNQAARLASSCFLQDRQVGVQTFINNLRKMRELVYQWRLTGREEKQ